MNKHKKGMTLLEVLITFVIISLLVIAALALIRPQEQFNKATDARRKHELNELRKIFEDWYSDRGCYPKKTEVCFNDLSATTCEICTSQPGSPNLAPYTTSVLCDPQSPTHNYLYQVGGDANCPTSFVVYSYLSATYNGDEDVWECGPVHGCGPPPSFGYDYLVSSPNGSYSSSTDYYCLSNQYRCASCGDLPSCTDAQDRGACGALYAAKSLCCAEHPTAGYCP